MDREGRGAPAQRCRTPREPPRVLGSAGPEQPTERPTAAVPLEGVQTGVNYAMIITNCNGLWRYMIGDTVQFVSTSPYTIRIT